MKKGLVFVALIFLGMCSAKFFGLTKYLSIYYLHEHVAELHSFVVTHYVFAVITYIALYISATVCAVPGSSVCTIAGGLLFGTWIGMCYGLISASIGAVLLFLLCRYLVGSWVQERYKDKLEGFNKEIEVHGHKYLLLIRLLAILPFFLVNILSGLTTLSVKTYTWVTVIGLVPVSLVYAYAGNQVAQFQTLDDFFSPKAMTAFFVFFIFKIALVPAVIKIFLRIKHLIKQRQVENLK